MNFFFFLMLARGGRVPPLQLISSLSSFFFGSFLSRLKVKCILLLQNYRCVKRIALPSPKQHAFLIPALFSLSLFFSSYTGDTRRNSADSDTNGSLSPNSPQPLTFLSHHLECVFNRDSILFVHSHLFCLRGWYIA